MTLLNNSANNEYKEFLLKQREAQSKFDYFFVGISLAFIAITFQAHHTGDNASLDYLLLLSWFIMLISLFFGIIRLRIIYVFLGVEAEYVKYIYHPQNNDDKINFIVTAMVNKQKALVIFGRIQIWSFFIGLCIFFLYQVSKMYPNLIGIFGCNLDFLNNTI